jgi:two-component system NarL family sensor kinase
VVLRFGLASLLMLVLISVVTALVSRRTAEREGFDEAKRIAAAAGRDVVQPALRDGILAREPEAVAAVDRVVRGAVLDGSLVRVKVWRQDGTIVYSDETRLIGQRLVPSLDAAKVDIGHDVEAEISDLSGPENTYERPLGKLVEAYLPIPTPNGTPVLFEAYFRYEAVVEPGRDVWRKVIPIAIGGLVLLQVFQFALAWWVASSLRRSRS